ncbi:hypothetical protein LQZ19_09105 [Treponema primitia]|uniref:hypothetical protein n=1 Tax=Treponema primitia TaxID=88058 RepID=UPI003981261C
MPLSGNSENEKNMVNNIHNVSEMPTIPKNTKRILLLFSIIGIVGCLLILIPQVRNAIILFGERFIVHRKLNNSVWNGILIQVSSSILLLFFFGFIFSKSHQNFLLLLPIIFGYLVVAIYGVNILYWDEWNLPVFINGILEHGIRFKDFVSQHNEHRLVFPKIVFLIIGLIFHINSKVYMYVSWILNSFIYLSLISYLKHITKNQNSKMNIFIALLLGFIVFDTIQIENLLWGFQIGFIMVNCFAVLSFYLFHIWTFSNKNKYLIFSLIAAVVSAFSALHGLFVLPVILCIMGIDSFSKKEFVAKNYIYILIPLIFVYTFYFYNYHKVPYHPDYFGAPLYKLPLYFFCVLGSPLIPRYYNQFDLVFRTVFMGFIIFSTNIIITIYLIRKKKVNMNIFPLCLIYFSFVFCASLTMGRVGFGIGQALSLRYTSCVLLGIAGLVLIIFNEFIINNRKQFVAYGLFALFFLIMAQNTDFSSLRNYSELRKMQQNILLDYRNQPLENLKNIRSWNDYESAKERIELIESHKWSVFFEK